MKLQLPEATLLIFNPAHGADTSGAILNWLDRRIEFGAVVHITDKPASFPVVGRQVYVPKCDWKTAQEIQAFELHEYFDTPFVLHIETDGFPVHFDKWKPEFLDWDYIGAPWPPRLVPEDGGDRVGNGGCSLQSRRFRELLHQYRHLYAGEPSDVWFTRNKQLRPILDREGIRIAPIEAALQFSFENELPDFPGWDRRESFGFHGKDSWCEEQTRRVVVEEKNERTGSTPV
jgi:hypothetical protein